MYFVVMSTPDRYTVPAFGDSLDDFRLGTVLRILIGLCYYLGLPLGDILRIDDEVDQFDRLCHPQVE